MQKFFWGYIFISLTACRPIPTLASIPTHTGAHIVQTEGRNFEIVSDPTLHVMRVYTENDGTPLQSTLTVRVQKSNGLWDRVHLKLSQSTPTEYVYTGLIPSRIYIAGALKFDVSFDPKGKVKRGNLR